MLERVVGGFSDVECSQDQFGLWEKVVRKVGVAIGICYSLVSSTSAWIEEVIVRRLRLGPVLLLVQLALIAMLCCVEKCGTGCGDSMCYHDLVRNGFHRPVLKHGPRSLTSMRVFGWKTLMRNESKGSLSAEVGIRSTGGTIDRSSLVKDLSKSISVGTRKMVIYA